MLILMVCKMAIVEDEDSPNGIFVDNGDGYVVEEGRLGINNEESNLYGVQGEVMNKYHLTYAERILDKKR